jgi:hypothetical protein
VRDENVRALNANVRQQRMQLIGKLLGLAAAGQDHSSRVRRGRARRRGLLWLNRFPVDGERANRSCAVELAAVRLCSVRRSPSP